MALVVPRATDLAAITPDNANTAATIINGQRRRSLAYQSAATIYAALTVH